MARMPPKMPPSSVVPVITAMILTPVEHVGGILQLFALATAYAGALYGINAFDQPGVELGKQFAYAMLGKPGSDAARAQWDALPVPDPRFRV